METRKERVDDEEDEEDYNPSEGEEDVETDLVEEEASEQDQRRQRKRKAGSALLPSTRRRRGGICLEDEEQKEEVEREQGSTNESNEPIKPKSNINDVWALLKSGDSSSSSSSQAGSSGAAVTPQKVAITETVEFAGEKIQRTRMVNANSKEAQSVQNVESMRSPLVSASQVSARKTSTSGSAGLGASTPGRPTPLKANGGSSLDKLVAGLSQKKTISTLEKSRMDWSSFKSNEGIEDELKQYTKNGYLDKQDFLKRTEYRVWEKEREAKRRKSGAGGL
mmetsp:Transcript_37238/g.60306  ORF Transcript_37238/g.60306 Transcript_37238/m.60306 type:complete len:279 (+) Transcript_37238:88-924(+)|eukprot:CAMPEP_0184650892 /NCGR_PEP_ID=MMETSP0308-20130426/8466_1 /TAXON_ID=38269 /ORGANISM="Gloeochaete witrockiana, Strain SAG 46.84" /LENGTH=278 /DNA_ID=CAMNT_0027084739 /DNA_START=111 /DNA_END=947 /DNA_ORIENTATION=+